MRKVVCILLFSCLCSSKQQSQKVTRTAKQAQLDLEATTMKETPIEQPETFCFDLTIEQEFIVVALSGNPFRLATNAYWKLDGHYDLSKVEDGQAITLVVIDTSTNAMLTRVVFFTQIALQVQIVKGGRYLIRFTNSGMTKLMVTRVQKQIASAHINQANSQAQAHSISRSLLSSIQTLENAVQLTRRNEFLFQQSQRALLKSTNILRSFQWVEAVVVGLVALLQVIAIRRITSKVSIV